MSDYLRFIRENLRWLAGGFLLCFVSSFGQTFFIALSGGRIRAEFGLSNGEFGGLYMLATLASALTLPQLGKIVDRISVARTALLAMPLLALACLLMSLSQSVVLLALSLYLLRLFGQGMMLHIAITAMGRWYAGHRGRAISLATLGLQAGEGLLPITTVLLFALIGWRASWALAAGVLLLLALPVVYRLMLEERRPRASDKPEKHAARQWTRDEVMRDPLFWVMLTGLLAPPFIGTTVVFHQAYLLELRGWPAEAFAAGFMVMATLTVISVLTSGFLIDWLGAVRVLTFFLLPLACACFALAYIGDAHGIFIFMGLLGVSYGLSSTLFGALWPEIYGTMHLGSIRSIIVAMMVLFSAVGPGLTGWLIDEGVSYLAQIAAMGVYCLAAGTLMLFVSRRLIARNVAEAV